MPSHRFPSKAFFGALIVLPTAAALSVLGVQWAIGGCQKHTVSPAAPVAVQPQLDQHCLEAADAWNTSDARPEDRKPTKRSAFYSWKLNTCVETTIDTTPWSYAIQDATYGFFHPPKWIEAKSPLRITRDESIGWVTADGYWEPIDPSPEKRLISKIAAKIDCTRSEGICREIDAEITVGALASDSSEYRISAWDDDGIVAEGEKDAACSIGNKLMIDFKANSISVIDYPKKIETTDFCKAFQIVNSYTLRGGTYMLMGLNTIFYCDVNGADSTILSKVREYHGDIDALTYSLWQDNGEGGSPATVKTPERPYSQDRCAQLFRQKLGEL
jgi:hypothetical protein